MVKVKAIVSYDGSKYNGFQIQPNANSIQEELQLALFKIHKEEVKITGAAVTLVAVTKNHPADVVTESLECGIQNIGENRVQEAKHKQEALGKQGVWHLIGHLQTNKARQAVALFDLIESIDSERLLEAVDKEAARIDKVQDILLQSNT